MTETIYTTGQVERMATLNEECGEVTQVIGKILRFGIDSDNNGELPESNRAMLNRELGDVLAALFICVAAGDVDFPTVKMHAEAKAHRIVRHLKNPFNREYATNAEHMLAVTQLNVWGPLEEKK